MDSLQPKIVDVHFARGVMTVDLLDARWLSLPLSWYPTLLHASAAARRAWKLCGAGSGIHWPTLDYRLSAEGMLAGRCESPNLSARLDKRMLASWAADGAGRVLGLFEKQVPHDDRPRKAIEAARAWARGESNCTPARTAAVAAHAAARAATDPAAIATARLCGHTAAIAHSARHAGGIPLYTFKALTAAAGPAAAAKEIARQKRRLPKKLWPLAFPAKIEAWLEERRLGESAYKRTAKNEGRVSGPACL